MPFACKDTVESAVHDLTLRVNATLCGLKGRSKVAANHVRLKSVVPRIVIAARGANQKKGLLIVGEKGAEVLGGRKHTGFGAL